MLKILAQCIDHKGIRVDVTMLSIICDNESLHGTLGLSADRSRIGALELMPSVSTIDQNPAKSDYTDISDPISDSWNYHYYGKFRIKGFAEIWICRWPIMSRGHIKQQKVPMALFLVKNIFTVFSLRLVVLNCYRPILVVLHCYYFEACHIQFISKQCKTTKIGL